MLNNDIYDQVVRILRHHLVYRPNQPYKLVEELYRTNMTDEAESFLDVKKQLAILSVFVILTIQFNFVSISFLETINRRKQYGGNPEKYVGNR